jgi:hypothetical protein
MILISSFPIIFFSIFPCGSMLKLCPVTLQLFFSVWQKFPNHMCDRFVTCSLYYFPKMLVFFPPIESKMTTTEGHSFITGGLEISAKQKKIIEV